MRVCLVLNVAYEAGGAETSVFAIRDFLVANGHDVLVIATDKNLGDREPLANIIVPSITASGLRRVLQYAWYRDAARIIRDSMRAFSPELVHLHTIGEFSPSIMSTMGDCPKVLTVHGPEEYTGKLFRWLLPAGAFRGGSYAYRHLTLEGIARLAYLRLLQRPIYRRAFRHLDLVLAPSQYMAGIIQRDFRRSTPVRVVNNGFDLPGPFAFPSSPALLFVGRLERVKGVHHLLRALQIVRVKSPATTLSVVGDGSELRNLIALASDLGISESVEFTGWLSRAELLRRYESAAVLVIPSVWPENFPTVALEAMACGRPIVATRVGGLAEIVIEGETGRLVRGGDVSGLARAIRSLTCDMQSAAEMGARAAAQSRRFQIDAFMANLLHQYEAVLQKEQGRR